MSAEGGEQCADHEVSHMANVTCWLSCHLSAVTPEYMWCIVCRIHTLEDMLEDLDLQTRTSLEEETARRQQTLVCTNGCCFLDILNRKY